MILLLLCCLIENIFFFWPMISTFYSGGQTEVRFSSILFTSLYLQLASNTCPGLGHWLRALGTCFPFKFSIPHVFFFSFYVEGTSNTELLHLLIMLFWFFFFVVLVANAWRGKSRGWRQWCGLSVTNRILNLYNFKKDVQKSHIC